MDVERERPLRLCRIGKKKTTDENGMVQMYNIIILTFHFISSYEYTGVYTYANFTQIYELK